MLDISLAAGRSRNYIRSLLTEGKEPGLDGFVAICDALGVNPLWVIYGGDEDLSDHAAILREYARLTPEQRQGFLSLLRTIGPRD